MIRIRRVALSLMRARTRAERPATVMRSLEILGGVRSAAIPGTGGGVRERGAAAGLSKAPRSTRATPSPSPSSGRAAPPRSVVPVPAGSPASISGEPGARWKSPAAAKATGRLVAETSVSAPVPVPLFWFTTPAAEWFVKAVVSVAEPAGCPSRFPDLLEDNPIGVAWHDVSQTRLARTLDAIVEDCVNAVGVDVNTASVALLTRISGLNSSLAANIVSYRDIHGAFADRQALLKVPRLGDKTFEQAAGFLRIMNGDNPLDASAVHPEAYPVVERILADIKKGIKDVIGDARTVKAVNAAKYADDQFGLPTVQDILKELEKPGRDPRPEFKAATFREGVEKLSDLEPGMMLEGVVTNVANFGAFVDIGVHQDGLVHVSALADRFVKDPHEVVKAGDIVKVKVLEVDLQRQRVALTMRMSDTPTQKKGLPPANSGNRPGQRSVQDSQRRDSRPQQQSQGAMAAAFAKLQR